MKRTYNKPELKSVKLIIAESLLTGSQKEVTVDESVILNGGNALSNEEGAHDIWGNEGNGIW